MSIFFELIILFSFKFIQARLSFFLSLSFVIKFVGVIVLVDYLCVWALDFYVCCWVETSLEIYCKKSVTFSAICDPLTEGYSNLGRGGAFFLRSLWSIIKLKSTKSYQIRSHMYNKIFRNIYSFSLLTKVAKTVKPVKKNKWWILNALNMH
jgi:hypothetical protein